VADKNKNEVGYKRPPKHSQFKPGQSGNPSGRAKHARNFQTDLREELNSPTTVTESGLTIEVSKQRAIIKAFIAAAIKGDMRAVTALLSLFVRIASPDEDEHEPSPEELEILDTYRRRERERRDSPTSSADSSHSNS
jgi:hypothetical protein